VAVYVLFLDIAMRRWKAAMVVLALVVLVVQRAPADDKDPVHKGKPLSAWVEQLTDRSATARQEAAEVLGMMGAAAKPAIGPLIAALGDSDEVVREAAAGALSSFGKDAVGPLTDALKHKEAAVRRGAADALGGIGPKAKAAGAALCDALQDKDADVRKAVAEALKLIEQP
jgi:HEAT repeat protein